MYSIGVSIVTRTMNREPFLLRAQKSIFSQNYKNFEWIIVNDGGDNSCIPLLSDKGFSFTDRVKEIHLRKNRGRSAAANIGIAEAKGKYIVLHDDDDSWNENFLFIEQSHCIPRMKF